MGVRNRAIRRSRLASRLLGRAQDESGAFFRTGLRGFPWAPFASGGNTDLTLANRQFHRYNRNPVVFRLPNGNHALYWTPKFRNMDWQQGQAAVSISRDRCQTFEPINIFYDLPDYTDGSIWFKPGVIGADSNGRIHHLWSYATGDGAGTLVDDSPRYMWTDDPGMAAGNWSTPANIDAAVNPSGWPFFKFGVGPLLEIQGGPQKGYLVAACYHRSVVGGTSYIHLVYSDDGGLTWQLGGAVDEGQAVNDNSNECQICEVSPGRLYLNCNVNADFNRKHAIITDVTAPIPDLVPWTEDGVTEIDAFSTNASLLATPNGDVYVMVQNNHLANERNRLTIFRSTDAKTESDPTFPERRVIAYGQSGSPAMLYLGRGEFFSVFERTTNYVQLTDLSRQYLMTARFSRKWVRKSIADFPDRLLYHFNEKTSGAISLQGKPIRDYGTHCHPGGGSAAASYGDGYLSFDGSAAGCILQSIEADAAEPLGGMWDFPAGIPFTIIMRVRFHDNAADNVILDNRNDTTNARGCTLKIEATTGRLDLAFGNGTSQKNVQTSVDLVDSEWHTIYMSREGNNLFLSYDNHPTTGSEDDGVFTTRSGLTASIGSAIGILKMALGSQSGGSEPATFDISYLELIRGQAITTGMVSKGSVTKTDPLIYAGNRVVPPTLPASWSSALVALGVSWDGGVVGSDLYSGYDWGQMPPREGQGVLSMRDRKSDKLFRSQSTTAQGFCWETLDEAGLGLRIVGSHATLGAVRMPRWGDATGAALIDNDFDFIHNSGSFAFGIVIKILGATGNLQFILASQNTSATQFGLGVFLNTSYHLGLHLCDGSGTRPFNQTFTLGLTTGVTYYLGIDGNGDGEKVNVFHGAYSAGQTPPSVLTQTDSTGNYLEGAQGPATNPLFGFARPDGQQEGNFWFKNLLLFNGPIGAAAHLAWAQMGVE